MTKKWKEYEGDFKNTTEADKFLEAITGKGWHIDYVAIVDNNLMSVLLSREESSEEKTS